tara:strand:+ start:502 stop:618 length:117 start_codon:yes stop_codon:yes gene_type:complete
MKNIAKIALEALFYASLLYLTVWGGTLNESMEFTYATF